MGSRDEPRPEQILDTLKTGDCTRDQRPGPDQRHRQQTCSTQDRKRKREQTTREARLSLEDCKNSSVSEEWVEGKGGDQIKTFSFFALWFTFVEV